MLRPIKTNILIKQVEEEQKTSFGIILEGSATTQKAKVIAVGNDVVDVKVGDVIIPDWMKVKNISGDLLVTEEHILMVLED